VSRFPAPAKGRRPQASRSSRAQISAGDLIIYYGGAHVGVAIDNNSVVHAPTPGQTVKISPINSMPIYAIRHIG
jgi:cell wall-associated NlpC family hydrolase